jgi:hypothetical protein
MGSPIIAANRAESWNAKLGMKSERKLFGRAEDHLPLVCVTHLNAIGQTSTQIVQLGK